MDFSWTKEQLELYESAREFARNHLNEFLEQATPAPVFDRKNWVRCAEFGVQGSIAPVELGGRERDLLSTICLFEGLGHGCRDNGFLLALNGHVWAVLEPVLQFASSEQRERFVPGLCDGSLIGSHAMTEPNAGSDAFSMQTRAEKVDGGYLLSGTKVHVGLAPSCDVALVFASTTPERGKWGLSAFLVESSREGFVASAPKSMMGLQGTTLGDIELSSCFVPDENRLGPEGAGLSIFNHTMEWERSFIFSSHLGAMSRQLDDTIEYANKRHQYGEPIAKFQSVSNRIADMKLRLETSRLLLYRAAWRKQSGERMLLDAALTKLHLSESFVESSLDAVRIHGALGYLSEGPVEQDLRDATGGVLYSGTSDIQRQLIARLIGI